MTESVGNETVEKNNENIFGYAGNVYAVTKMNL
jgi:hypothetical protein